MSAHTIPFSARRERWRWARSSFALPCAPRLSSPSLPAQQRQRVPSVAIIHWPPGGQEVIRDGLVDTSTGLARCGRRARAGRGTRQGGLAARSPRPRRGGGEKREGQGGGVVNWALAGGGGAKETLSRLSPPWPGHCCEVPRRLKTEWGLGGGAVRARARAKARREGTL